MQIFQEIRKKRGFRHDILRIFKKFLCQIVPHKVLRTPMSLSRNPKKFFFHRFFEVFWAEKNFFSNFFGKTVGIIQELIFNHF